MKKLFALTFLAVIMSFASFAQTLMVPSSICTGSTATAMDSTAPGSGTWASSNTTVATITASPPYTAMITGIAPGTAIISYTIGGTTSTSVITVTASPAAISGITSICVGTTSTFSDATPGGAWSSFSPSVASIGTTTGVQTGVSAGYTLIEYSIGSCVAYIRDTVVGGPYVDTTVHGASTVCVGSTITLSDATPGGAWSSTNPSVATVGASTGVVTGVSTGTTIISYTVTGICGSSSAQKMISVVSTVSAGTITGTTTVMATYTTYLYDGVTGGTWSSSNPSVATISSSGVVTGVAAGTTTITYTVSGCGGTSYTTAVVTVTPYDIISGHVLFGGTSYTGMVKVWLITYDPSTLILAATDSTIAYSSGSSASYQFINNPTDSYRVKAAVYDTSGALVGTYGYIPTYHTSSYYWYAATVLPHTFGTADVNQDINMSSGIVTAGPGFIAGNVTSGANKGTSGAAPVVGLRMYVLNSSGAIMQTTTTDASGNYTFSTLPYGTYTVFPEDLNYKTTAFTGVNITSSAITVSGTNFVQHTKSMTITPVTEVVSNVTNNAASVFVFPNPSNGKLNVQWNTTATEKGAVTISDVTGRQVFTTTVNMNEGTGMSQVDLSGLTNGLYIISVKSASINYNNKIEIQK